jgi:hypothetical protein
MTEKRTIEIHFQGEKIIMDNALIAGKESSQLHYTAMYGGSLDLDELHNLLFYAQSTVIKILTGQFDIPFEHVDDFLLSAMSEAITKEWNVMQGKARDVDIERVSKYRNN